MVIAGIDEASFVHAGIKPCCVVKDAAYYRTSSSIIIFFFLRILARKGIFSSKQAKNKK